MTNEKTPGDELREKLSGWELADTHGGIREAFAFLSDGKVVSFGEVSVEETWPDTLGSFPAPVGWSFNGVSAAFDGTAFHVVGLTRRLLRALAERPDVVVPDVLLMRRVWGCRVETAELCRRVSDLRGTLLAAWSGKPPVAVERVDGGYRVRRLTACESDVFVNCPGTETGGIVECSERMFHSAGNGGGEDVNTDEIKAAVRKYGDDQHSGEGWALALLTYHDDNGLIQTVEVRPAALRPLHVTPPSPPEAA